MERRQIITLAALLLFVSSILAQNDCHKLFYQYNPEYLSARTSSIVINQISQNCIDNPFDVTQRSNTNSNYESLKEHADLVTNINTYVYSRNKLNSYRTEENYNKVRRYYELKAQERIEQIQEGTNSINEFSTVLPILGAVIGGFRGRKGIAEGFAYGSTIGTLLSGLGQGFDYSATLWVTSNLEEDVTELLKSKYALRAMDVSDCVSSGDFGDCFNNLILPDLTGRAQQGPTVPFRLTKEQARDISDELFNEDPSSQDNSLSDLSPEQVKQSQSQFASMFTEAERQHESNTKRILESTNLFGEQLEQHISQMQSFQTQVRDGIAGLNSKTDAIVGGIVTLEKGMKENRLIIEENRQNIAVIQDMLYASASPEQRLIYKKNCLDGKLPCPQSLAAQVSSKRDSFMMQVAKEEFALNVQNFASNAKLALDGLKVGLDLASELGLSDEDAENVAEGLFYAEAALSVGLGVVSLFTAPDPATILQGIQGLTSLIGGPPKPMPSPELQAIMQLRQEMHERFDRIEQGLETILKQQVEIAKELSSGIQANRDIMQFHFSNIQFTLGDIVNKQNVIISQLKTLLDQEFNNCRQIYNTTIKESPVLSKLSTYQNYVDIYNASPSACNQCVTAIRNRLNPADGNLVDMDGLPSLDYFAIDLGNSEVIDLEYDSYRKLATFYKWYYGENLNRATDMLFLPSEVVSKSYQIYCELRNDTSLNFGLNPLQVLSDIHYLDAYSFREFIELYSVFYPYMEIQDFENSESYRPRNFFDMVEFSSEPIPVGGTDQKENRLRILESHIKALQRVHEIILAQQSLMSGTNLIRPFYMILYQDQYNNQTIQFNGLEYHPKQFVTDILSKNPLIAQNFMVYLLRKNYRFNEAIYLDTVAWQPGIPRNPSEVTLLKYGYDSLPIYEYFRNDSFKILEDSYSNVDVSKLAAASYTDVLKFEQREVTDDYDLAFLKIDLTDENICITGNNVVCSALIPFPESALLYLDKFSFTEAYEFAQESEQFINSLADEIYLGGSLNTSDWSEVLNLKYSFLEP